MQNFLRTLFTRKSPSANSTLPDIRDSRLSLKDTSENGLRQQLVIVMMRDLLRKSGIPPSWVECYVQIANSKSRGQGLYVRLVLKHWDERLMKYAFAFQKTLLTDIVQFEPKAAGWLHGISWQLEVATSCPYPDLPERSFWVYVPPSQAAPRASAPAMPIPAAATAASVARPTALFAIHKNEAQAVPENDTKEDLERLFAIRDQELAHNSDKLSIPAGYENTEPSPLI